MIPDRITYLLGSDERIQVLESLSKRREDQCTIAEACSISRSTVHRNLVGIRERGWARETDGGYELTAAGEGVLAAYREFADTVATLGEHEPLLEHLDGFEPPPVSALDGCETTVATTKNPHAPTVAAAETIRRNAGDSVRIVVSGVSPITNEAGWEALESGSTLETIVDRTVLETLEGAYDSAGREALGRDGFTMRFHPDSIETGLVLAGDEVCVTAAIRPRVSSARRPGSGSGPSRGIDGSSRRVSRSTRAWAVSPPSDSHAGRGPTRSAPPTSGGALREGETDHIP